VKIFLISTLYPPLVHGGAEIYVGRLARALATEHEVVVVTSEPGFRLAPRREVTPEGIVVYRVAPLNVGHLTRLPHHLLPQAAFRAIDFYHPQVAATMSDLIRRERPDLIHLHNWVGLSLAAMLASVPNSAPHIPVAMTLHDYGLLCAYASTLHPDGHTCAPDLPCRLLADLSRWLVNSVGLVISPSHYVLDEHLRRGFFRRATQQILPYGLEAVNPPPRPSPARGEGDSRTPSPTRGEGDSTRGQKGTFDILYMGRVQFYKGTEVLIRAFRRTTDPTLRLHVAGTGPSVDSCKALALGDDRIRFYGFVSGELRRSLMENADCMVLPSLWPDNYPVSIQEAFQSGPVVVASRIGGIPEMVRDGVNGLLVEPGDVTGIAGAIGRLRSSPELVAKLRASAFETARLYDMRFHVAHLVEAYQRLLVTDRLRPFDRRAA
jgi:glycosyltransferase involved in cell wall biosynthesis